MMVKEIQPDTGLPKIQETRVVAASDPKARKCTCDYGKCLWYPLPRNPFGDLVHILEDAEGPPWYPRHQQWVDGGPWSLLCWKCGRPIKGWRRKMTPQGDYVTVDGEPAVSLALFDHYRAKRFQVYRPRLDDKVEFDALHCADCDLLPADGLHVVAMYLAGLLEGHWCGEELGKRLNLSTRYNADELATFLSSWAGAEPMGAIHRSESDAVSPRWRS